ncbi:ABC transporter permease [Flammeovirga aprica]|uniref:FtsX-like permease family protein n=1 Tax=Flammeovirga aprica JL-4 TaxID=694437 RepID=A0A7X9P2N9_9BACT|nr:FtsX-like permease family protein [Flammeovirga aprica]NME67544.1 FtsX-like permease family protein [Flammeovirga aprica JL-4]
MIKHSLYILWTRKSKNALMVAEIAISFIILFLLFTLLFNKYKNFAHPIGFNTENIMILKLNGSRMSEEDKKADKQDALYDAIFQTIHQQEEVLRATEIDYSHPYTYSRNTGRIVMDGGIEFEPTDQRFRPSVFDVLEIEFIKGRAFTKEDAQHSYIPIVVNNQFYQKLKPYLSDDETFVEDDREFKIFGVMAHYNKESDYKDEEDIMIQSADFLHWLKDSHQSTIFVKTKNDPRKIEAQLVSAIERINPKLGVSVDYFDSMQEGRNKWELLPLFLISFVALFLVINIALGLYGVLWYNISKRKSEIGIRRAMGASEGDIFIQMLTEVFILAFFGILIGGIFAIQFPILGAFNYTTLEYMTGALLSLTFVLLITIACGYYPSKLATKVTPNEALHEL